MHKMLDLIIFYRAVLYYHDCNNLFSKDKKMNI